MSALHAALLGFGADHYRARLGSRQGRIVKLPREWPMVFAVRVEYRSPLLYPPASSGQ
jgi:hypothetical protein